MSLVAVLLMAMILWEFGGFFDEPDPPAEDSVSKPELTAANQAPIMSPPPARKTPAQAKPAPKPPQAASPKPSPPRSARKITSGPIRKTRPAPKPPVEALDLAELTNRAKPLIVRIEIDEPKGLEPGNGFLMDKKGLIATRYQTIQKATAATAVLSNGVKVPIRGAVYTDPPRDIAILKVDPVEIETPPICVVLHDLRKVKDTAGFYLEPSGELKAIQGTVEQVKSINATQIVTVQPQDDPETKTKPMLSPSLCGGPLFNLRGTVVGMITAFEEDRSIQAVSSIDLQRSYPFGAEEVVPLSKLSRDEMLAKYGLNLYMMTEDLNVSIPKKTLQKLEHLAAQESRSIKHYAKKGGTRFHARELEWNDQAFQNYLKVGSRKPAWDEAAVALLDPRLIPHPKEPELLEAILKTDCDDPVVLLQCATRTKSETQALELAIKAAALLDSSAYPLHLKFKLRIYHLGAVSRFSKDRKLKAECAQKLEESLMLALFEPNLSVLKRRMLMSHFYTLHAEGTFNHPFRNPKDLFADKNVDPWIREMLMAYYHKRIAWEARGTGVAGFVSPTRWEMFHAHIDVARFHYLNAWTLQPDHPEPLTELIGITMASRGIVGESPRFWFERAVEAEIDYLPAYSFYLQSLQPRWGGSINQMLAFGRECLESGRFDTKVPMQYHTVLGDILGGVGRTRAISQQPSIFEDYRKIFEGYIAATDDPYAKNYAKSQLACIFILANKKAEAKKLVEELGPDILPQGFNTFGVDMKTQLKKLDP